MFGMGFTEIVIIAIIAILFLGPDKLPEAMVEIAKFFRNMKRTVSSAKASLEHELNVADIREEALNYKKELTKASDELNKMADLGNLHDEIHEVSGEISDAVSSKNSEKKAPPKPEVVTFKKTPAPSTKEDR
ncbi:MAG: Sec-independent protein translocase TatB [Sulfurimonas sp.]|nr:MAG: Sec-independent protein translocase TatB [Sulfurimonas sp.]